MNSNPSYLQRWKIAFNIQRFRLHFIATLLFLTGILFFIPYCFNYIQNRNGVVLNDYLLDSVGPMDVSWITFTLIYACLLSALVSLSFFPERLLLMVQAYCVLTVLRVMSMLLIPLNEPAGIIILKDPVIDMIGYDGKIITKDLFFSGHVSTVFLLYLSVINRRLKTVLLIAMVLIAGLILVQHVHYTVDILAAPLFSFIAFRTASWIQQKRPIER